MFAKPIYSFLLLFISLLAWLLASFGGSSQLLVLWPGALALGCVAGLGGFALARGFHGRVSLWCVGITLLFYGWIMLRGTLSEVHFLARQDMVMATVALISYALVAGQFERALERRWILALLLAVLLGNVLWGIVQQTPGQAAWLPQGRLAAAWPQLGEALGWTDWSRGNVPTHEATGFYVSENHLAGLIELTTLPALAFFLLSRAGLFGRLLALAMYGVGLYGAMLAGSRAGLVCLIGGTCFVLALWWLNRLRIGQQSIKKTLLLGSTVGVVVLAVLVGGAATLVKRNRVNEQAYGEYVSQSEFETRLTYAKSAYKLFQERPVDGQGGRAFEYEERRTRDLTNEQWLWYTDFDNDAIMTHNDYAQLLCDYGGVGGLLGALVLLLHLGAGAAFFWRRSKEQAVVQGDRKDDRLALTLGALGGIVALTVHSVFDFNLHIGSNAMIAAILLGLLANPGRESLQHLVDETGDPLVPRRGLWLRAPLIITGVVAAGWLWLHGPDWYRAERLASAGERARLEEDYFTSTAALQAAIEADPTYFPAYFSLGYLNVVESARVKQNYQPNNEQERIMNAKVSQSFLRRALEIFDQGFPYYPKHPYAAMMAGTAASQQGDFATAEVWYNRALKYGQANRRLHFEYGQHLIRQGDQTGDPIQRLAARQRALDQYILPAREKLRSGGPYQKYIDGLILAIRTEITSLQSKLTPAPTP